MSNSFIFVKANVNNSVKKSSQKKGLIFQWTGI